jgi:hypothetical protein
MALRTVREFQKIVRLEPIRLGLDVLPAISAGNHQPNGVALRVDGPKAITSLNENDHLIDGPIPATASGPAYSLKFAVPIGVVWFMAGDLESAGQSGLLWFEPEDG